MKMNDKIDLAANNTTQVLPADVAETLIDLICVIADVARNEALDEAARVAGDYPTCVDYDSYGAQCNMRHGIATTIRRMKS